MKPKTIIRFTSLTLITLFVGGALFNGCATPQKQADAKPKAAGVVTSKGGAQLWTENCMRCHNIRSPASYSDAQWEVAMLHMRVRANLTAGEHKKILAFLKTGN